MGRYSAYGQVAAAAVKPMVVLGSDGTVFPEVIGIRIGFSSTPADNQFSCGLYENTDMGTGGTSVTVKKIGHAGTSGVTAKKGTFSADPTKTGNAMIAMTIYQRSHSTVFRGYGDGWKPETLAANRGLGNWCDVAGAAMNMENTLEWIE